MTYLNILQKMTNDAQKNGVSLAELAAAYLRSGGKTNDVKLFITKCGQQPAAGVVNFAMQAGQLIYEKSSPEIVRSILGVNPEMIPNAYKQYPFYDLMRAQPSAFLACLVLYEESPGISNAGGQGVNQILTGVQLVASGNVTAGAGQGIGALKTIANDIRAKFASKKDTDTIDVYEFWKAGKGQVNEGRAVYSKFAKKYFFDNYKKDIEKNPYGLSYEEIAAAWPKYASMLPGIDAKGGNLNDLLKIIKDNEYSGKPGTLGTGGGAGGNLPEIGKVNTPWGEISWGVTNNKAMLLYAGIAAVVIIGIFYFSKKK